MQTCQPIKATTQSGTLLEITVLEEPDYMFSVLMRDVAFPFGTLFSSPEEAVIASVNLLNGYLEQDGNCITKLYSIPVEEFITNEHMADCLNNNQD